MTVVEFETPTTASLRVDARSLDEAQKLATEALAAFFGSHTFTITRFEATAVRMVGLQGAQVANWEVDVKASRT